MKYLIVSGAELGCRKGMAICRTESVEVLFKITSIEGHFPLFELV